MATRRNTDGGSSREPTALDVVRHLLGRLKEPPKIDPALEKDPEALAELLLDYSDEIEGMKLLNGIFRLLLPMVDELVCSYVAREYLLIHPVTLAEDAIARMHADLAAGRRIRPVRAWFQDLIERSALLGRSDPDMTFHKVKPGGTTREWMLHKLCVIVNESPLETRHVAWLKWMRNMKVADIARVTSFPFERLELLIGQIAAQAAKQAVDAMGPEIPDDEVREGPGDVEPKDEDLDELEGEEGGHG